ncbi:MAG: hypothetical protein KGL90_05100 [Burkholderiales bacterium]|nr:hypothetical protein [Burkholderiales bacterium]
MRDPYSTPRNKGTLAWPGWAQPWRNARAVRPHLSPPARLIRKGCAPLHTLGLPVVHVQPGLAYNGSKTNHAAFHGTSERIRW